MSRETSYRKGIRLRGATVVEVITLISAVSLVYWPYLQWTTLTTGGDMANLFYPLYTWGSQVVGELGVWPLWNPFVYSGHPFLAAAQSSVFYPPVRLLYAVMGSHPIAAMNLHLWLHVVWAAVGMWHLARSRMGMGLRGMGPWIAGFAFGCNAWWWGQMEHGAAVATSSWTPWLIWVAGWMARKRSVGSVMAFGGVIALQVLGGHPQEAFYGLMAAVAWAAWCGWQRSSWKSALSARLRSLVVTMGFLIAGGCVAGLVSGVQLLPTMELSRHSYRQFDGPDFAARYSMPFAALKCLVQPHPFGSYKTGYDRPWAFNEYGLYVGIPVLLLGALGWGMGRWRRRSHHRGRGITALWGWVAVVGILLALGGNADLRRIVVPDRVDAERPPEFPEPGWSLLRVMTILVPPTQHFRVPARNLLLWVVAISLLAGCGARSLEVVSRKVIRSGRGKTAQVQVGVALVCGVAVFLSLLLPSKKERFTFQANYRTALDFAEDRRVPIPEGEPLDHRLFRLTLLDDDLLASDGTAPRTPSDLDLESRVALRDAILSPNLNLLHSVALMQGYEEGLLPTVRYKDFLFTFNRSFRDANPDARLLALGGVRWLWSELPIQSEEWEAVTPARRGGQVGTLYRNREWRGVVFEKSEFPEVVWESLEGTWILEGKLATQRNTERVSYVIKGEKAESPRESPRWTAQLVSPNEWECTKAESTLEGGRSLVVAQTVFPGWVARDGEGGSLPMKPLNAWNQEIESRPDTHRVVLRYEPWSFRLGAFLSGIGILVMGFGVGVEIAGRESRRKAGLPPAES